MIRGMLRVSILTRPEGRMRHSMGSPESPDQGVSILTRPEGRMRPRNPRNGDTRASRFQSSPDPKAGCDYRSPGTFSTRTQVSILTRPEGRMRHPPVAATGRQGLWVSILTRPEGRMRPTKPSVPLVQGPFQSSPDPKAGCDKARQVLERLHQVSILTRPEGRMRRNVGPNLST